MDFGVFDTVILGVTLLLCFLGFSRGALWELCILGGLVFGFWASNHYAHQLEEHFTTFFWDWAPLISRIFIVSIGYGLGWIVGGLAYSIFIFSRIIKFKILGFGLGLIEAAAISAFMAWAIQRHLPILNQQLQESFLGPLALAFSGYFL